MNTRQFITNQQIKVAFAIDCIIITKIQWIISTNLFIKSQKLFMILFTIFSCRLISFYEYDFFTSKKRLIFYCKSYVILIFSYLKKLNILFFVQVPKNIHDCINKFLQLNFYQFR